MTLRTRHPLSCVRFNPAAAGGWGGTISVIFPPPPPAGGGHCDWLKQVKRFTTSAFLLAETNCLAV